ncbi:ABC transporter ATP-binding protein/permease [Inquilinus limosus]|uniref:ABC transporter ATP-binding protein/permease n=1 Tax=Inquilinus limosus TaxID=171674 RepID=UPI0003F5B9D0|nr:ABC transporter ATP-binding protein/permease [Inquilinus limosus]
MAQAPEASRKTAGHDQSIASQTLPSQLLTLFRTLRASPGWKRILVLVVGIVIVVGLTAASQIRLNAWNQPFYDALAQKSLMGFFHQLMVFAVIAGVLLALNVAQAWLNQTLKVRLREGLTRDLFTEWLKPKRAFRLAGAGEIGENPDQRIHEDTRHLTELSTDLGIGLLQSTLLLISFVGVLWVLSEGIVLRLDGMALSIPGYMVWCALLYAAAASWVSWRVGRPLIDINAERYAREADLRSALVRVNEHVDGITLDGGEADERRRLDLDLDRILAVMGRYVRAVTNLTWVTAGYGWFTIVAPILVASPGYFGGDLTFGELMMAVGAFIQVQQALRWFVDNFSSIADWRATLLRVMTFREALIRLETLNGEPRKIEFAEGPADTLGFEKLGVLSAGGLAVLDDEKVEIRPGERVLIVGRTGGGKSTLFRAFAGLWPWGTGRILVPPEAKTMFLPQRPYLPPGRLRDALTYPQDSAGFTDEQICAALRRTEMGHHEISLDQVRNWDKELTSDELQTLTFARLLLHKPQWVFIDEMVDALDEERRKTAMSIFEQELPETAVITIARREVKNGFYTRVLRLHLTDEVTGERRIQIGRPPRRAIPSSAGFAPLLHHRDPME